MLRSCEPETAQLDEQLLTPSGWGAWGGADGGAVSLWHAADSDGGRGASPSCARSSSSGDEEAHAGRACDAEGVLRAHCHALWCVLVPRLLVDPSSPDDAAFPVCPAAAQTTRLRFAV